MMVRSSTHRYRSRSRSMLPTRAVLQKQQHTRSYDRCAKEQHGQHCASGYRATVATVMVAGNDADDADIGETLHNKTQ